MADSTVNIVGISQITFQSGSLSFVNCTNDTLTLGISGGGSGTSVTLQTNSVSNSVQSLLNITQGIGISLSSNSVGGVAISISGNYVTGSSLTAGKLIVGNGTTTIAVGDLSGDVTTSGSTTTTVVKLQGNSVSNASPTDTQVLSFSSSANAWSPQNISALPNANASQIQSTSVASATPLDGSALTYVKSNSDWEPRPPCNLQYVAFVPNNSTGSPVFYGFGTSGVSEFGTVSAASFSGAGPASIAIHTTATASRNAGVQQGNSQFYFQIGNTQWFRCALKLGQTTNMRIWIGLCSLTPASLTVTSNNFQTDTPNLGFLGFRYSTAASDSKYQCVTQSDNTHQTVNAETTSSHVDTNFHFFEFCYDGTNVTFFIDGTQVGQQSGNLPANATGLAPVVILDNVGLANDQVFSFSSWAGSWRLK